MRRGSGKHDRLVSLRVSERTIEMAEALIGQIAHLPNMEATAINRSVVLRLAIERGLDLLEEESKWNQRTI
jgi:hypothetical protein